MSKMDARRINLGCVTLAADKLARFSFSSIRTLSFSKFSPQDLGAAVLPRSAVAIYFMDIYSLL